MVADHAGDAEFEVERGACRALHAQRRCIVTEQAGTLE
jgi:hypothetical protein